MSPPRNTKAVVFIHVFLAIQVLAPLSYYTVRADRNDERFAWRMFSSVRMLSCQVEFRTGPDEQPVSNLYGSFHEAWIQLSRRGRGEVIDAMAKELCRRERGADAGSAEPEVRARVVCRRVDGEVAEQSGSWNLCRLGAR